MGWWWFSECRHFASNGVDLGVLWFVPVVDWDLGVFGGEALWVGHWGVSICAGLFDPPSGGGDVGEAKVAYAGVFAGCGFGE